MDENEAMAGLMANPDDTFQRCGFGVRIGRQIATDITGGWLGGRYDYRLIKDEVGVNQPMFEFDLTRRNGQGQGSGLYFFPTAPHDAQRAWRGGIGACVVPADAPDGTIVITDGMNGCTLQVWRSEDGGHLLFMHDYNGVHLDSTENRQAFFAEVNTHVEAFAPAPHPGGAGQHGQFLTDEKHRVCAIDPSQYMPEEAGEFTGMVNIVHGDRDAIGRALLPRYYPIALKTAGKWNVYYSGRADGIIDGEERHYRIFGTTEPGRYKAGENIA